MHWEAVGQSRIIRRRPIQPNPIDFEIFHRFTLDLHVRKGGADEWRVETEDQSRTVLSVLLKSEVKQRALERATGPPYRPKGTALIQTPSFQATTLLSFHPTIPYWVTLFGPLSPPLSSLSASPFHSIRPSTFHPPPPSFSPLLPAESRFCFLTAGAANTRFTRHKRMKIVAPLLYLLSITAASLQFRCSFAAVSLQLRHTFSAASGRFQCSLSADLEQFGSNYGN